MKSRLTVLTGGMVAVLILTRSLAADLPPTAPGPFQPTLESLSAYKCPDWFRDAKFGIWAHWGPQAVPMAGDWYARHMYVQGNRQYQDHLEHYGHPSTNGYKDIIPLWKAEKWDPDRLMALYKKAGAKYFVSMGSHHDNFFLWDSKIHKWNAVQMGPHRDVVGEWQRAARKQGLRFGVSEHLGASFTWWQDSHRSDKTGPLAGVPYDGADPQYQDLYHFPAEPGDTGWYSKNPRWHQIWYSSIRELVDKYQPDLLYTDGGVPFGNEVGRSMIAHLYNSSAARHRGTVEAIYTCKQRSDGRWVEDLERGVMPGINPYPWQTDTSIGDWFYNKDWRFRPVSWTIHMLVDIVSKNGNLLLNIVQRPDGSLDPEVEEALGTLASWVAVHGEAIYETRPWQIYGEGAVSAAGGSFREDFKYSAADVRFTTKGKYLYALALGWPENRELRIRALAAPAGKISAISLLGYKGKLEWSQTPEALVVKLPEKQVSPYTTGLKITGRNLKPFVVTKPVEAVKPDPAGTVKLVPEAAVLNGSLHLENQGRSNIGFWDNPADSVEWKVAITKPGKYAVSASFATVNQGAAVMIELGQKKIKVAVPQSSGWADYHSLEVGELDVAAACELAIKVRAADPQTWKAVNLAGLTFRPL